MEQHTPHHAHLQASEMETACTHVDHQLQPDDVDMQTAPSQAMHGQKLIPSAAAAIGRRHKRRHDETEVHAACSPSSSAAPARDAPPQESTSDPLSAKKKPRLHDASSSTQAQDPAARPSSEMEGADESTRPNNPAASLAAAVHASSAVASHNISKRGSGQHLPWASLYRDALLSVFSFVVLKGLPAVLASLEIGCRS